jgi:hypothetical protein
MPELKEVFEMVTEKVEPDRDAWVRQEHRQRAAARTRKVGALALVGCLLAAAAVFALTLDRSTGSKVVEPGPAVVGAAPTSATVIGVWRYDGGPDPAEPGMLMVLNADGTFAIDAYGLLDTGPATRGTYRLDGKDIVYHVGPSARCPNGESFSLRTGVVEDGRLHTVMTEPGCSYGYGTEWTWTRLSPVSARGAEIATADPSGDAAPPEDVFSLRGIWLLGGTGQVLRISWSGAYAIDDAGRLESDPFDEGTVSVNGRRLTFTSGRSSRGCEEGAGWIWQDVALEPSGRTMRAEPGADDCGHGAGSEMTWIMVSGG